ncbi:MAG: tetratricopeptide repeat protein [Acidobacteriota bacterium]
MSRSFHRSSTARHAALLLGLLLVTTAPATFAEADAWTQGVQAFRAGDLDTAATHIASVVDDKPDWYGGHLMLGQVRLQQKRADEAVRALVRAHQLAPTDVSVRLALGQAALASRDYARAVDTLAGDRPQKLDDKRWSAWLRVRGEAAIGTGDHAAALADFTTILKTQNDASLRWKASTLARRIGDPEAETRHLRAGERLTGADADRFLARRLEIGLTNALEAEGDAEVAACAALAVDARRLAKSSKDAAQLTTAGRLLGCGAQDDAATVLARATTADPADPDAAYHLGRRHALDGRFAAAEKALTPLAARSDLESERQTRVFDWLGYSIERQQRFDEALTIYRRGGLTERIAAAEEARAIHVANLEAEAKAAEAQALIDKINQIEGEMENGEGLR